MRHDIEDIVIDRRARNGVEGYAGASAAQAVFNNDASC